MSKTVVLPVVLVALSALAGVGTEAPPTESKETPAIKWYASYGEAKARTPKDQPIVMLVFTSQQCPWCERLKEETLKNAGVVEAVKAFRNVLLTPESAEYAVLARKFRLQGVPHTAFVDDDGGVLAQVPGFAPGGAFLKRIEQAKEARKEHRDKVAAYKKAPRDPRAAIAVLESLVSREQLRDADEMRETVLELVEKNRRLEPAEKNALLAKARFIDALLTVNLKTDADRVDRALVLLGEVEALASKNDQELAAQALWFTAFLHFQYDRLKDPQAGRPPSPAQLKKSVALLEGLVDKYPETKWAGQARRTIPGLKAALERVEKTRAEGGETDKRPE